MTILNQLVERDREVVRLGAELSTLQATHQSLRGEQDAVKRQALEDVEEVRREVQKLKEEARKVDGEKEILVGEGKEMHAQVSD